VWFKSQKTTPVVLLISTGQYKPCTPF